MLRRDFITLLGNAAAAWPFGGRAEQRGMPVIGFFGTGTPSSWSQWTTAFVNRLRELGRIEGRTVKMEYRWAEGRNDRYPEIATELVRLKVDVIFTQGTPSSRSKAGDICHPDCICVGGRPGRQRACRDSGASWRQRHRPVVPGDGQCTKASRALA
jgi:putative ABC transport system substrate-binding protein